MGLFSNLFQRTNQAAKAAAETAQAELTNLVQAEAERTGKHHLVVMTNFTRYVEWQNNMRYEQQIPALAAEKNIPSAAEATLLAFKDYLEDNPDKRYIGFVRNFDHLLLEVAAVNNTSEEETLQKFMIYLQEEMNIDDWSQCEAKLKSMANERKISLDDVKILAFKDYLEEYPLVTPTLAAKPAASDYTHR